MPALGQGLPRARQEGMMADGIRPPPPPPPNPPHTHTHTHPPTHTHTPPTHTPARPPHWSQVSAVEQRSQSLGQVVHWRVLGSGTYPP